MTWDPLRPAQPLPGDPTPSIPSAGPWRPAYGDLGPDAGVGADPSTSPATAPGGPATSSATGPRNLHEILRSGAFSGIAGPVAIPDDARTIVVYNPLSKPWFLTFDGRDPIDPTLAAGAARSHDLGVPGQSITTYPLPASATILKALCNNAAPSAADSGYEAIFNVTSDDLSPSTALLA